jgi:hypothetical protein
VNIIIAKLLKSNANLEINRRDWEMATRKIFVIFALTFSIIFILMGCGYKSIKHGEEITPEHASSIIDGQTTKKEIFMNFGEPTKTMDKEKVFFYSWTRGGKGHVLGFGSGSAESKSLVIVFDDKDTVVSHKITRGATTSGATVGD